MKIGEYEVVEGEVSFEEGFTREGFEEFQAEAPTTFFEELLGWD
jgi:hypothetical protein